MAFDPTENARKQAAETARLDEITGFVKVELQKLGQNVTLDVSKSEGNPDARYLSFDRLNVRASFIQYGANKGRIDWQGYAKRREFHTTDVPRLGETTSAADASASRIAKQIVRSIVEPAQEALERYNSNADIWDAHRAALPAQVAKIAAIGFECQPQAAGATEAQFYISRKGVSGSARVNSDGSVYLDRLSLDAETARCVLEFLAARSKG